MIQISFHGLEHSDAVAATIERHAAHLAHVAPDLTRQRAVVEAPNHRHRTGNHYRVLLELGFPHGEIVVGRAGTGRVADENVYTAIARAFDIAARKLAERPRRKGHARARGPWAAESGR